MPANVFSTVRIALLFAFCLAVASCESGKARDAALQYAFALEQTVKGMGLIYMSDLAEVRKQVRHIQPVKDVIEADGSEKMKSAAGQLEVLVLYVGECLDNNVRANVARPEGDPKPVPVDFPNQTLNALLGLNVQESATDPKKALTALRAAIVRFAHDTGIEKDYREALQRREAADVAQPDRNPKADPTWAAIVEAKVKTERERKTKLAAERSGIEKEVVAAKAPPGFAGAKWLMSPEEVKSVRPNVAREDNDYLIETMEWLGRPAKVRYGFDNGFLIRVIISFTDNPAEGAFDKIQNDLQEMHGKMPAPRDNGEFFASHFKLGRFAVWHILHPSKIEQVLYARENTPF